MKSTVERRAEAAEAQLADLRERLWVLIADWYTSDHVHGQCADELKAAIYFNRHLRNVPAGVEREHKREQKRVREGRL